MYQIDFNKPCHAYFIGIGGISMSGLAEILLERGFSVSGSDRERSSLTETLAAKGADIRYGQKYENLSSAIDVVIYTNGAIHPDNPELLAAHALNLPILTRTELLGQIMKNYDTPIAVSGTHGKTTTTSMISEILMTADTDPTLSVGGILESIGGNIRIGRSGYFVAEACEYTNSFLSLFPKIGLILNIEADHLDFFKDLSDIRRSFRSFAGLLPADGTLIINGAIEDLSELTKDLSCRIITFGSDASFDYSAASVSYDKKGCARFTLLKQGVPAGDYRLGVPGEHNILNALAAIALSAQLDLPAAAVKEALASFKGTKRRFEYKGALNGVTIIDDYAHHPTEITATLTAAQKIPHKTLWCVFQPHTYTRTKSLMKDFAAALSLADRVILAKIYPARETDDLGISSATLQEKIKALGKTCYYFEVFDEIEDFIQKNCEPDDLLITMGAGDIVKIGENLLK